MGDAITPRGTGNWTSTRSTNNNVSERGTSDSTQAATNNNAQAPTASAHSPASFGGHRIQLNNVQAPPAGNQTRRARSKAGTRIDLPSYLGDKTRGTSSMIRNYDLSSTSKFTDMKSSIKAYNESTQEVRLKAKTVLDLNKKEMSKEIASINEELQRNRRAFKKEAKLIGQMQKDGERLKQLSRGKFDHASELEPRQQALHSKLNVLNEKLQNIIYCLDHDGSLPDEEKSS